jgi:hypothetical protein
LIFKTAFSGQQKASQSYYFHKFFPS